MSLLDKINQEIAAAMKAKDAERLSALRMVKTALKNREIEKMSPLDEAESSRVLQSLVKQRRDSIEQYEKAGRAELAAKEAAEIKVIEEYLPAAVDEATMARVVEETLAEIGATSAKDMGRAMKAVMAKFAGQPVDGKVINGLVRAKLGA
ncbi:MAG TPA: GatB/YqeY domain-containing protein [Blastocatellia bacterium]|nr:GatB/YqeY domain-containing protein [Blastocatellia bacterium]